MPTVQVLLGNLFYSYSVNTLSSSKLDLWKEEYEKECGLLTQPYF